MEILKLTDVLKKADVKRKVVSAIKVGKVFVYPTDTIYGIGCNAEISGSVQKIADAKGRSESKMFSVIAPGKEWVWSHTTISKANRDLAESLLPGPYTLILPSSSKSPKPVVSPEKTIGVRIPRHPFTDVVEEAAVPFVTTSVNLSGQPPVSRISEIPNEVKNAVDIVIDAGHISGHPSRIFDMRTDDVKVIKR